MIRIRILQDRANLNYKGSQGDMKRRYDRKTREVEFLPGDTVLMRIMKHKKGHCMKFSDKFTGPYEIMSRISVVNYMIQSNQTGKMETVHVNRLKEYVEDIPEEEDLSELFGSSESEEEFEGFSTVSEGSDGSDEDIQEVIKQEKGTGHVASHAFGKMTGSVFFMVSRFGKLI